MREVVASVVEQEIDLLPALVAQIVGFVLVTVWSHPNRFAAFNHFAVFFRVK